MRKRVESILSALNTLKVATFEADGESNLAKYGLDAPRLRINLKRAQKTVPKHCSSGEMQIQQDGFTRPVWST